MNEEVLRRSPLHEVLHASGACFEARSGWLMPTSMVSTEEDAVVTLTISDESAHGKLLLEGDLAAGVISTVMHIQAPMVGYSVPYKGGRVYSLRPDLFFVATMPGLESELMEPLRTTAAGEGELVTVTDVTAGQSQIRVTGNACRELLPRLCGLDFGEAAFPDGCAKTSSLAKTTQLILRSDSGGVLSFLILGGRSLAAYIWDMMVRAGQEWNIKPVVAVVDNRTSNLATGSRETV